MQTLAQEIFGLGACVLVIIALAVRQYGWRQDSEDEVMSFDIDSMSLLIFEKLSPSARIETMKAIAEVIFDEVENRIAKLGSKNLASRQRVRQELLREIISEQIQASEILQIVSAAILARSMNPMALVPETVAIVKARLERSDDFSPPLMFFLAEVLVNTRQDPDGRWTEQKANVLQSSGEAVQAFVDGLPLPMRTAAS